MFTVYRDRAREILNYIELIQFSHEHFSEKLLLDFTSILNCSSLIFSGEIFQFSLCHDFSRSELVVQNKPTNKNRYDSISLAH